MRWCLREIIAVTVLIAGCGKWPLSYRPVPLADNDYPCILLDLRKVINSLQMVIVAFCVMWVRIVCFLNDPMPS